MKLNSKNKQIPTLPPIVPNTPIPPRSRACCFADSPRRGEYGALGRPSGRRIVVTTSKEQKRDQPQ
jgi:hypothetical protein